MNNFEKIKAMSIDEMAEWLDNLYDLNNLYSNDCPGSMVGCRECIKQWLEQETEE